MKKPRLTLKEYREIEKALASLPYPLHMEREGKGPVRVFDEEGNEIKLISYNQLPSLLLFIQKNCLHENK